MQQETARADQFENPLRTWAGEDLRDLFESLDDELGEGIRVLRLERGWSQRRLSEEVARLTGVSLDSSAITRIEAGRRTVSFKQAMALAVALDAPDTDSLVRRLGDGREEIDLASWAAELRSRLRELEAEADFKQRQVAGHREQLEGVLAMLAPDERERLEASTDG